MNWIPAPPFLLGPAGLSQSVGNRYYTWATGVILPGVISLLGVGDYLVPEASPKVCAKGLKHFWTPTKFHFKIGLGLHSVWASAWINTHKGHKPLMTSGDLGGRIWLSSLLYLLYFIVYSFIIIFWHKLIYLDRNGMLCSWMTCQNQPYISCQNCKIRSVRLDILAWWGPYK